MCVRVHLWVSGGEDSGACALPEAHFPKVGAASLPLVRGHCLCPCSGTWAVSGFPSPRAEGNRGVHTPSLVYLGRGLGVEILGLTSHDCEVSGSFLHRVTLSLIWGKQGHGNLGLTPQAGREEEQGLEWR